MQFGVSILLTIPVMLVVILAMVLYRFVAARIKGAHH